MIERFLQKIVNADGDAMISLFGIVYIWKGGVYVGSHKK